MVEKYKKCYIIHNLSIPFQFPTNEHLKDHSRCQVAVAVAVVPWAVWTWLLHILLTQMIQGTENVWILRIRHQAFAKGAAHMRLTPLCQAFFMEVVPTWCTYLEPRLTRIRAPHVSSLTQDTNGRVSDFTGTLSSWCSNRWPTEKPSVA